MLIQSNKKVELANLTAIASNKKDGGSFLLKKQLPLALTSLLCTPFLSGHIVPQNLFEIYQYIDSFMSLVVVWKFSKESDSLFESNKERISYVKKKIFPILIVSSFLNGTIYLP